MKLISFGMICTIESEHVQKLIAKNDVDNKGYLHVKIQVDTHGFIAHNDQERRWTFSAKRLNS